MSKRGGGVGLADSAQRTETSAALSALREENEESSASATSQGASRSSEQSGSPASKTQTSMHARYGNRVVRDALSGDSSGVGGMVASEMTRSVAGVGGEGMTNTAMLVAMRLATPGAAGVALRGEAEAAQADKPQVDDNVEGLMKSSGGMGLPEPLKSKMEKAFGADFSNVVIHDNSAAAEASTQIQARAFTVGQEIWFGSGEYSPDSRHGQVLIAHELMHVVQAQEGRIPTATEGDNVSSPTDPVEQEAYAAQERIVDLITVMDDDVDSEGTVELPPSVRNPRAVAMRDEAPAAEGAETAVDPAVLAEILSNEAGEPLEELEESVEAPAPEEQQAGEGDAGEAPGGEAGGGGGGEDAGGDPELPPSPFTPPPPRAEAPPIEAPDLTGETPAAVAEQLKAASPTQRAMGMGDVGPSLTDAAGKQNEATNQAKPQLTAEMSAEPAPEAAGPVEVSTESAANPDAVSQNLDTAAPVVEVAEAEVGADVPLSASAATSQLNGLGDEASEEDMARAIGQALSSIPSGGDVNTSVDVPNVPLQGEADPGQMAVADADTAAQQDQALTDATQAVHDGPGPEQAQLMALDEPFDVEMPAAPNMPEFQADPQMSQYLDYELPAEAQAEFDVQQGEIMAQHIGEANVEMETAEADYNLQRDEAFTQAEADVAAANADVQSQQEAAVTQARADITTEQNATIQQQQQAVASARGQMDTERQASMSQIDTRVSSDQGAIDSRYTEAQSEADRLVSQGERDAAQMETDADKAAEDQSWWDRAVSAVADALNALVSAISDMWSAIRDAVAAALDAAVAFANDLIDACLAFVTELLNAYYDFLQFLVQELLGDIFPGLADALCAAIDAVREFVLSTLDGLAQMLKDAVAGLAAGLLAALDGLIALINAAAQMYQALIMAVLTGDWELLAEMAIRAVLAVIGIPYDQFVGTLGKLVEVWDQVLENPGAVVSNGIDALVLGFENFAAGFVDHFIGGAVEWITGAQGLEMPDTFDIMGIFDITCQVLGLTTDHLEEKAREHLGDGAVDMIQEVMGAVNALLEGGWGGLWEYVQGRLSSLVDDVVIAMGTWLVEKAILVAGRWIAGLIATCGASAILEALIGAWQFAMWVIDQASMMWGIVSGVIESVHEFVFGNIAPAAKKIEDALADMIPVAIDLVAKLLNIGNIADKVQDIIEGVREMIDGAIDAMFETLLSALGLGGDSDQEDGEYDGEIGEEVRFSADGESHRLWIDAAGSVMVASTPMTVQARLDDWYARRTDDPSADNGVGGPAEENRARAEDYISRGRTQLTEVNSGVTAVQDASEETRGGLDTALEGDQGNLATTLTELFKLYADEQANTGTEEERVAAFAGTQHGIVQDAPSWPHDKDGSSWRYTRNSDDGPSPKTNGGAIVSASRDPWTRATYEAFIMSHSGTETHATELDSGGRAKHCIAKLSGHNSYILYDAALGTGIDNVFDKDDEGTADATLVELTNSGNLTTFFAQVASGTVPGLELPAGTTARQWFAERWAESASKDHVKRLFRQRVSGNHEWIPCANIPAIIDRASNETDLDKGSKWITAQDTLRINTADVIFSPDKEVDEEITYEPTAEPAQGFHVGDTVSVPQGHVGAVYLHSRQRVRGQQTFHEDCNNALTEDLDETIDNLKGVFEDWVWQSGTWDNKVHPETLQKGGAAFPASPPNSGMLAKFDQAKRG